MAYRLTSAAVAIAPRSRCGLRSRGIAGRRGQGTSSGAHIPLVDTRRIHRGLSSRPGAHIVRACPCYGVCQCPASGLLILSFLKARRCISLDRDGKAGSGGRVWGPCDPPRGPSPPSLSGVAASHRTHCGWLARPYRNYKAAQCRLHRSLPVILTGRVEGRSVAYQCPSLSAAASY
jgi:hypothetical protein